MALSSRTLAATSLLLLSLVILHLAEAHQTPTMSINNGGLAPTPVPQTIDCGEACEGRCKLSSRPRLCKRACGSCCAVCKCVPPGTSGNHDSCPCYASLTTRNQIPKCP